jgi:hypothetical protein
MTAHLKNIKLKDFRKYLESKGLKVIRTNGGHEVWGGKCLLRPIVLQTHVDPIPEFIIRNNLRQLDNDRDGLLEFLGRTEKKKKK